MEFFHPDLAPFTIALLVMAFIALLEIAGLLFGVAFSELVDSALPEIEGDLDADLAGSGGGLDIDAPAAPDAVSAGPFSKLLSWLCVGRVPILILLAAFLIGFGLSGLIVQEVVESILGFYLPGLLVSVIAIAVALPVARHLGLIIARLMPKEETDAVARASFIGQVAVIIRGNAKIDLPAEAKLKDIAGTTQYILVAPDSADEELPQGTEVLIVEKKGAVFIAIPNNNPALSAL